ncbi:myelin and lymphocyte protein-like [Discoglossus pictus]
MVGTSPNLSCPARHHINMLIQYGLMRLVQRNVLGLKEIIQQKQLKQNQCGDFAATERSTMPNFSEALMIFELVFGAFVWLLIAFTNIFSQISWMYEWFMCICYSCFLVTLLFTILHCTGAYRGHTAWTKLEAIYHTTAAVLNLSFAVCQNILILRSYIWFERIYDLKVVAMVSAYLAALSYVIHAVYSLRKWKRSA